MDPRAVKRKVYEVYGVQYSIFRNVRVSLFFFFFAKYTVN